MNKKNINRIGLTLGLLMLGGIYLTISAQCPMCSMAVESNLADGGNSGKGLNAGIFYILVAPYILAFTVGIIWWRRSGRFKSEENVLIEE